MSEFLIILIIAIAVIPVKNWPDVARFFARLVKYVRNIIWKINDGIEQIQEQIDLEKPIDDITGQAIEDIKSAFATPLDGIRKKPRNALNHPVGSKSSDKKKIVVAASKKGVSRGK